jgi:hypothetical protein
MVKKSCVPYGSDVSAGTYQCADCGHIYSNQSKKSLPPCPNLKETHHEKHAWNIITGQGDSPSDPYPNK